MIEKIRSGSAYTRKPHIANCDTNHLLYRHGYKIKEKPTESLLLEVYERGNSYYVACYQDKLSDIDSYLDYNQSELISAMDYIQAAVGLILPRNEHIEANLKHRFLKKFYHRTNIYPYYQPRGDSLFCPTYVLVQDE